MRTYQDLLTAGENKIGFTYAAIQEYRSTRLYRMAKIAEEYDRHLNTTIYTYIKLLYTIEGNCVPDNYSANFKIPSNFFNQFVTQQSQFLLGKGITFKNAATKKKLGKNFDTKVNICGRNALVGGVAYGFFNLDHIEVFKAMEFVPLYDEEDGALKAGIRFWQIAPEKPLRATLYELDGYTEYIWNKSDSDNELRGEVLKEKRAYILKTKSSVIDGTIIYDGQNYPTFPIVPFFANEYKQSELVGLQQTIDAYDLINSGFANDLDDASQIYWMLKNAGGMDDVDMARFIQQIKTTHVFGLDDDVEAEAHTLEVPYAARDTILTRLEKQLYKDYGALDPQYIASGAVTATQIKAAYEPLNHKADRWQVQADEFIQGILTVAGVEDEATYTRSMIINESESTQMILSAAQYLDDETILKHLPFIGPDEIPDIINKQIEEEANRFESSDDDEPGEPDKPEESDEPDDNNPDEKNKKPPKNKEE